MKKNGLLIGVISALVLSVTANVPLDSFLRKIPVTVSGWTGSALTNFPVLVRLNPSDISGFTYDDLVYKTTGADIRFMLPDGTVLDHDIDTWNPSGESLIWVKIPRLSAQTTFALYYRAVSVTEVPDARAAWSSYAGVWHMAGTNDASGTVGGAVLGKTSGALVWDEGVIGKGLYFKFPWGDWADQASFRVPGFDAGITDAARVNVSGWFRFTPGADYHKVLPGGVRLFSRKKKTGDTTGSLDVFIGGGTSTEPDYFIGVRTQSGDDTVKVPIAADYFDTAVHLSVQYDGTAVNVWTNGILAVTDATTLKTPVTASDTAFGIGCFGEDIAVVGAKECKPFFGGRPDEVRVYNGVTEADRARADVETVMKEDFLSFGPPEVITVSIAQMNTPKAESVTVSNAAVSVSLILPGSPAATVSVAYGTAPDALTQTNAVGTAVTGLMTAILPNLTPNTVYWFSWIADNASGSVRTGPVRFTTPADISWTGNGGADHSWLTDANWTPGSPKNENDRVTFSSGSEANVVIPTGLSPLSNLLVNASVNLLFEDGATFSAADMAVSGALNVSNAAAFACGTASISGPVGRLTVTDTACKVFPSFKGISPVFTLVRSTGEIALMTDLWNSYIGMGSSNVTFSAVDASCLQFGKANVWMGRSYNASSSCRDFTFLADASAVTNTAKFAVGSGADTTGTRCRFVNQSVLSVGALLIGYQSSENTLFVGSGSRVVVRYETGLSYAGPNNTVELDDGKIDIQNNLSWLFGTDAMNGDRLILRGTDSRITVSKHFVATNSAPEIVFALPPQTYSEAPIQVGGTAFFDHTVKFVFDVGALNGRSWEGDLLSAGDLRGLTPVSVRTVNGSGYTITLTRTENKLHARLVRGGTLLLFR